MQVWGYRERLWSLGLRFPKMKQMREIRNPKITKSFTEWFTHKDCFGFSHLQLNFTTFPRFSRKPNKRVTKSKPEKISKTRPFWFRNEKTPESRRERAQIGELRRNRSGEPLWREGESIWFVQPLPFLRLNPNFSDSFCFCEWERESLKITEGWVVCLCYVIV